MDDFQLQQQHYKLKLTKNKHEIFIQTLSKPYNTLLKYDLKTGLFSKYYDKIGSFVPVEHQYHVFKGIGLNEIYFEEEKFKELLFLSRMKNENCKNLSTYISRLYKVLHMEGYIQEGIKFNKYLLPRHDLSIYSKNIIKFFRDNDLFVTRDFERNYLDNKDKIEKYILKLETLDLSSEDKLNFFNTFISTSPYSRHPGVLHTLLYEHNYDFKALTEYMYNYLQRFEGLSVSESVFILKDYYTMASRIGRKVKKYPKYLKSMHDIIQSNYRAYKKEYPQNAFLLVSRPELKYDKDSKYVVIIPQNPKEVIDEGTQLNHCVSSYVDDIINDRTYILFLRYKKTPENSLITLEYKNGAIVQAKGNYNRAPSDEERKTLEKYCRVKNIKLQI